jgi:dolichol-phosphate mannosyltransferase
LEDADLVSGIRAERHDSWQRRLASRVANRIRNAVVNDGVTDVGCSLKAYRAEFLAGIPVFDGMHRFLPALVKANGARVREITVNHRARKFGVSKYTIGNRLWRGLGDLYGVWWLQRRWIGQQPSRGETP